MKKQREILPLSEATPLEMYVLVHTVGYDNRTIGQVRKAFGVSHEAVSRAMDKVVEAGWLYLKKSEIPKLPPDGLYETRKLTMAKEKADRLQARRLAEYNDWMRGEQQKDIARRYRFNQSTISIDIQIIQEQIRRGLL